MPLTETEIANKRPSELLGFTPLPTAKEALSHKLNFLINRFGGMNTGGLKGLFKRLQMPRRTVQRYVHGESTPPSTRLEIIDMLYYEEIDKAVEEEKARLLKIVKTSKRKETD